MKIWEKIKYAMLIGIKEKPPTEFFELRMRLLTLDQITPFETQQLFLSMGDATEWLRLVDLGYSILLDAQIDRR